MLLPLVIGIGTLLVAHEYEKRAETRRADAVKTKIEEATTTAKTERDAFWKAESEKAEETRQKLDAKKLAKENERLKNVVDFQSKGKTG